MTTPDIRTLTEPPIVGKYYMVPCVEDTGVPGVPIPVLGPPHEDADYFNVTATHYHQDVRFMSARLLRGRTLYAQLHGLTEIESALTLIRRIDGLSGPPVMRRMKCKREAQKTRQWSAPDGNFHALRRAFSGRQCKRGKSGWICPHKNYALGSQPVGPDGYVTCPLHGLRIHAETGVCEGKGK